MNPKVAIKMSDRDFTIVKDSPIHGKGVFAKKIIPKGTRIFEYTGEKVLKSNLVNDLANGLTSMIYVMNLNDIMAIDGERGGNDARFINHSCDPNCEVLYFDKTPYIYASEEIITGTELSFDYKLGFDTNVNLSPEEQKNLFPCHCGTANCRGTLLGIEQK
jgi:SET domain-containing protein